MTTTTKWVAWILSLSLIITLLPTGQTSYAATTPMLSSGSTVATNVNVYVDPTGNDVTGTGTKLAPFKTLFKARSTIRAYKGNLPAGGVTVWVKGGTYNLATTFDLNAQDSGTPDKPVIYRTYPGETVTLTTGKGIDPTSWQPLSADAAARVNPAVQPSKLRELDVASLNIQNIAGFSGGTTFTEQWGIVDLIVDGIRQPISQWPNEDQSIAANRAGWVTMNGSADSKSFYYGEGGTPENGISDDEVNADGTNRIQRWKASMAKGHDLYLKGFWRTAWSPVTSKVGAIYPDDNIISLYDIPSGGMGDKFSKTVVTNTLKSSTVSMDVYRPNLMASSVQADVYAPVVSTPSTPMFNVTSSVYGLTDDPFIPDTSVSYRVGTGKEEWKAINYLDEIDVPGEWALDFKDGKIYYYPTGDITKQIITLSDNKASIIKMSDASYIQWLGFTVEGGMGNGIEMQRSHHMKIAGNTICYVTGTGIVDYYGNNNLIQSNDVYEIGAAGISMGYSGDRTNLVSGNSRITNNHIFNIGTLVSLEGIVIRESVGTKIDHNLIHDTPKAAVKYTSDNNLLFEYNEIHNTSLVESDSGAFYTPQDWTSYGNVLRYNFIHHNKRSHGFYFDDGDSGDVVSKNIIQQSQIAFIMGGGHDNLAQNNLIIASRAAGQIDDRGITRGYTATGAYAQNLISKNPTSGAWLQYGKDLKATYGYTTNLWADILNPDWHPEYPNGSSISDNVFVQTGAVTTPKKGSFTVANNVILNTIADAQFYNANTMDYRTNNASILSKFTDLNTVFPQIGLSQDEYRVQVISRSASGGMSNH
ncbi:right-handed parallel beta-helix repeat-containing protein [Paenibacillus kyungheensis]|uniref:Right-handed parallel beta-helix repeat-containing protein n=1 Tax=Paenibacillus kyungheensis TaxID=1452732 RepID=A0AAX3LXG5_9BACL|nr:right-handed parallel beta-helix repeat-containing protein [Paenibacillus kyungheensis]WCT54669.1 right-handed parallel beta-helix repeat-containing protein [Paenibacillus kyungheensis]